MVGRLFQIIYILMERESVTAGELADKLEVSVRTINRDIEKLSEARIPVYATKGRGGGISLLPDFVLNKKLLTEDEKSSILSAMRLMGTVAYEDEKQALSRLESFFGEAAQDWIEIELDSWGEGVFDKERFKELKDAILTHKKVYFSYDTQNAETKRTIHPYKLVFRAQAWYIYGYCELRHDFRYFKFHRMHDIIITGERFAPVSLPANEPHYYRQNEQTFCATVAFDKEMAYRVYDELPPGCITDDGTRLIVQVENASRDWFFSHVLSYGFHAEILAPKEIREEMRGIICKMQDRY